METRRLLKSAAGIPLAFILLFTLMPSKVIAWGNIAAHPEINRRALDLFLTRQQSDSYFKGISLNGDAAWGLAWDPADGNSLITPKPGIKRQKTLADWIIDGGYSADEPEGPMGMRHFYDPTNKTSPWLTDTDWIAGFLRRTLGSQATNPEISAVDWANNKDEGFAKMDVFSPQEYSFPDAKDYFKQALADKSRDNPAYGNAWRAVGETMHLVADMSLAPHVRNDGHGLGDGDPVEVSTTDASIGEFSSTNWTTSINYDQSVTGLIHDLAAYTNRNFFSKDTIPIAGKTTTANGQPVYPNPDISKLTVNKAGYLVSTIDGQTVRLARQSAWYRWGLSKNPGYTIDAAAITDQQRILTPTIVRATEAVIERFLPRFEVQATVKPDPDSAGKYIVRGSIIQSTNAEWKEKLIIRNGAYVIVKGSREIVGLFNNPDLNEFTHSVTAQPGDEIKVVFDLGGYVIESPPIKINSLTIDPPTLNGEVGKEYTFTAKSDSPPANATYQWSINNSVKQNTTSPSFKTKFTDKGDYAVSVKLVDSKGLEAATATAKVAVKDSSTTPVMGYWELKDTTHTESKANPDNAYNTWKTMEVSDGYISAVGTHLYIFGDLSRNLEYNYIYTWSPSAKNGNVKEKLYPGDVLEINMTLNFKGADPAISTGQAQFVCDTSFNVIKYEDRQITIQNPGGLVNKTVRITIPLLRTGTTNVIRIECSGGSQGFTYTYNYQWVDPSASP